MTTETTISRHLLILSLFLQYYTSENVIVEVNALDVSKGNVNLDEPITFPSQLLKNQSNYPSSLKNSSSSITLPKNIEKYADRDNLLKIGLLMYTNLGELLPTYRLEGDVFN